jgi:dihydroorotate dehydrogenase (NAD+) catalytic subunit
MAIENIFLANPVFVASGTFGYGVEMSGLFDLSRLGGIIPKTVTLAPRVGNPPPRTVETSSGLINSIGLDNDGIDEFLQHKLPYLVTLKTRIVVSIAIKNVDETRIFGEKLGAVRGVDAVELNVSCPNVSGGVDFAMDACSCESVVGKMRAATRLPLIVKLSPNVRDIGEIAKAAEAGGADAISAINTCPALAVDWKKRRPRLGNGYGGLSGKAIKPIALRAVRLIYNAVKIPVIGIGGIESIDDAMEFFITGATAIQIGTANFYNPTAAIQILDNLPNALNTLNAKNIKEIIGTLQMN